MSLTALDHLTDDLKDYVRAVLRGAYIATAVTVLLALGLFVNTATPVPSLMILMGGMALSIGLRILQRLEWAVLVYIATLLLATTALIIDFGLNDHYVFLYLLPVIAATGMVRERGSLFTAVLAVLMMFGATWLRGGIMEAVRYSFVPGLICLMLAAINMANTRNLLGLVEWAIDIQGKDTQRAEAFFAQKMRLEEAHLKLQHANSALEQANARLEETNVKLEKAERVALQASQAKSTFMSNMSHELRTPLNVIIGYSSSMLTMPQMFNDTPLPVIYHEYVQLIEDSGHYLLTLINDILDLSKIEASKLSLYPENVALPPLLRGVIATAIGLVKDKPIVVRPNFDDNLSPVYADPTRVRQILLNLMSNAIKFTASGSVTLSAVIDDDMMRISVTDTGIGIPPEALERIFDRYQQAEQDTDKRYGGTGLGLDISKQLSLMHGGDLTVTSTLGQGSTFSFTLPLARTELANKMILDTTEAFAVNNNVSEDEDYQELLLVLLVEDQESLRELIRKSLESSGYHVLVAHGGHEPVEMADALQPALIILDTNLVRTDSETILRDLRSNPETASIPVILCTNTRPEECPLDVICLAKPVTPKAVLVAAQQLAPRPESQKRSSS